MRKLFVLLICLVICVLFSSSARAVSNNVVINYIQTGDLDSSSNEIVEIYNNSSDSVEITNWCLYYASATNSSIGSKMSCVLSASENTHIYIPAKSSMLFVSNQLISSNPAFGFDEKFSATLLGTSGHILLLDDNKNEIDKVGWGLAVSPETKTVSAASAGSFLIRKMTDDGIFIDTDNNYDDFEISSFDITHLMGNIFEIDDLCLNLDDVQAEIPDGLIVDELNQCVPPPVDICENIPDLQVTVPIGFGVNEFNECVPDLCSNIDNIQTEIPVGFVADNYGCHLPDLCLNLDEIQNPVPNGYYSDELNQCFLEMSKLNLSEILPNAIGLDDGTEYIELYNPNDFDVILDNYRLFIGSSQKMFSFTTGQVIRSNQYLVIYSSEIKFTLLNSSDRIQLLSVDGQIIDEIEYVNPAEGESWIILDKLWQYTNRPTPGLENLNSEYIDIRTVSVPCGPNQYRNPETNRCRNIATNTVLAPCKDGQYRSEETGRCRNIISDVSELLPCDEGEERNLETNRCRKVQIGTVLGVSELKPCAANQYRNPETNRCKNIVTLASANYQPENVLSASDDNLIILSYAAIFFIAIMYGIWEWRSELMKFAKKLRSLMHLH